MSRTILMTGATGFIGRALALALQRDGDRLIAWVRDPAAARNALGREAELLPVADGDLGLARAVGRADAIINLAGAPIMAGWWTQRRREQLIDSRVGVTSRIIAAIASARAKPEVLVSASAVGFYGDRADERLPEWAAPGDSFAARLCESWEREARRAETLGVRVVCARIGVVLGREGGALAKVLPLFRAGLGGPIGGGRQYFPWIHIEDAVAALAFAVGEPRASGALNLVGPTAISQRDFAGVLGAALGRPAFVPAPRPALRLALGDRADVLLASHRVIPARLGELGFGFRYRDAASAAAEVAQHGIDIRRVSDRPDAPYLRERRPRYLLSDEITVAAPLDEVFEFFSNAENLAPLTPPDLRFDIRTPTPIEMKRGQLIDYNIRIGPAPIKWKTLIEEWKPGVRFVDAQIRGPYRCWYHEHSFAPTDGGTVVRDRVHYAPPLGPLGAVANRLFVAPMLRRIFSYRRAAVRLRFGELSSTKRRAA